MRFVQGPLGFASTYEELRRLMTVEAEAVDVGEWQSIRHADNPMSRTWELQDVSIQTQVLHLLETWQQLTQPNLPWAEDHFQERVSGQPLNPPPSNEWWPFAQAGNADHKADEKFSHTYPERFWPKFANVGQKRPNGRQVYVPHNGIRFEYGDLEDLVFLLAKSPMTRQAYLPVWFPEDTGAVHGERVPCTLGYHFMIRRGYLRMVYYMRSCDLLRHFRDDVYMAGRLLHWVRDQLDNRYGMEELRVGKLLMHIGSLHVFEGDMPSLRKEFG